MMAEFVKAVVEFPVGRLKDLANQHSEFIGFCRKVKLKRRRSPLTTRRKTQKIKKVDEVSHELDELNKNKPWWMRKYEGVTNEEHVTFKSFSNNCLSVKHFSVESQLEFRAVLLMLRRAPFDMLRPRRA